MTRCRVSRLAAALFAVFAGSLASHGVAADHPGPGVGERIFIDPKSLAAPGETASAQGLPKIIEWTEPPTLQAPEGFEVSLFASGLSHARWMTIASDGAVFLSEPRAGHVLILRDTDGDGAADFKAPFIEGLSLPHGLDIWDGFLYVADVRGVYRVPIRKGDNKPLGSLQRLLPDRMLGNPRGHWTRNVRVTDKGRRLYVSVGSQSNIAEEELPHASIQDFDLDKRKRTTLALGMRNPVGMAFEPTTGDLYTVVNERDGMGDELVPDYLTRVERGDHFGWPYAYIGSNPQPGFAERAPHIVERAKTPDVLFRSHSAPLGLVFYTGTAFPKAYRGDAFVALHGSWNASNPRGYMVARVPFNDGKPEGYYEPFVTGFWSDGEAQPNVIGRPTGLAVTPDGDLLISDDATQSIWRVRYRLAESD